MLRNKTWCKLYTQMYFILVFEPLFITVATENCMHPKQARSWTVATKVLKFIDTKKCHKIIICTVI